jgi:hypothetical protein
MTADIHADRILILDFGSQYTQLIARRVRELGVYCEIHPWDDDDEEMRAFAPKGIILSGGPESVTEAGSPRARRPCSRSACRCSASATACRPWRAARRRGAASRSARIRLRRSAPNGHSRLWTASKTASTPRATACSTCG